MPRQNKPWQISPRAAALFYAGLGLKVFPCTARKTPAIAGGRGLKDATANSEQIEAWWAIYRYAEPGFQIPKTGVAVDLEGVQGKRDFERVVGIAPDQIQTPQASTPRGGLHLFFRANGRDFMNAVKVDGLEIDVRAYGGYVVLPGAGNGRDWIPGKPNKLAPLPAAIAALMTLRSNGSERRRPERRLEPRPESIGPAFEFGSRYGRVSLERICQDIALAPDGAQEITLNSGALRIGRLIRDRELPPSAAKQVIAAGMAMTNYDLRRPWSFGQVKAKVDRAIGDGARS
jgi:hypothetical protein